MDIALFPSYFILLVILTIFFSVIIDFIIGDPHLKYHPVNIIGNVINWLKLRLKCDKRILDKIFGVFLLVFAFLIFCIPLFLVQVFIWWIWKIWDSSSLNNINFLDILLISFIFGFILKWSFAIKNLGDTTIPIGEHLKHGDIEKAKKELSFIVRRDTETLDNSHIISAAVEVIAESSTDAVTSVFWFFLIGNLLGASFFTYIHHHVFWLFLGIPSAYIFRIINTADSIVGYKDSENIDIGWFSARMDDLSNFFPTRLTVLLLLLAGKILKKDVKNAWKILKSDKNHTESVNGGWTMGTMAGLLNVQLEKIGSYKLGISNKTLRPEDIRTTFRIVRLAALLFIVILSIIIILIMFLIFTF
ncbi:MAG: adenosylcobinamide-phosphate synthase CbiB [Promethearchaeota archaeon]